MIEDGLGNRLLCKCGNAPIAGCFGLNAYMVWCADCDPREPVPEAKLVYRPPNNPVVK